MTMPPSQTARPAALCPPPRTATSRPCARATLTALTTSSVPAQRTISAGERSIMPFQTLRASSYPASPGRSRSPRTAVFSSWIAVSCRVVAVVMLKASLQGCDSQLALAAPDNAACHVITSSVRWLFVRLCSLAAPNDAALHVPSLLAWFSDLLCVPSSSSVPPGHAAAFQGSTQADGGRVPKLLGSPPNPEGRGPVSTERSPRLPTADCRLLSDYGQVRRR